MNNKKTYLSKDANIRLKDYLESQGRELQLVSTEGIVSRGISNHPDVFFCKLGLGDDAPIHMALPQDLGPSYPQDSRFNAACTGKFFIHNLRITSPPLLEQARDMGMTFVDVMQGYSKCSIAIVDESSIITCDQGIYDTCLDIPDLSVLKVAPGHVRLDGYPYGFIGGTCGRVGNELIFNGNLGAHPDFVDIVSFIEERGVTPKWFPEYQLTDIGSIL